MMKKVIRAILIFLMSCFVQKVAAQKYFDFENGNLPPEFVFSQNSKWRVTTQSLDGNYSLCDSVLSGEVVSESFSFSVPPSAQAKADTFRTLVNFSFGTTQNTIGNNRFAIFIGANLGAEDMTLVSSNNRIKSFVLTFVGTSGNDTLRLYSLQSGGTITANTSPIISTNVRVNRSTLAVQLICTEQGALTLEVGSDFNNMQLFTANDVEYRFAGMHVGVHLITTNTPNRKWLRLDNMSATMRPIEIPPMLNQGDVVINEVLFNPNTDGVDFVELYNRSDKVAELQGVRIANRNLSTGALNRSYALPQYAMQPNDYVVITANPDVVREQYYCENPDAFITLSTMPSYPNDAGCVTLLNLDSTLLEDFYYTEKMHSGALVNKKGVSLERINPNRSASEEANWLSAAQVAGFATPTYKNSQYSAHAFGADDRISLSPEVFSPDGDGVDDVLFIGYKMPSEGYVANITIFTSAGRIAKMLCRNTTLAVEGQLMWDGVCDNGKLAEVGVYIVFAEVFSLDGKVNRYKKTCVVGARF